MGNSYEISQIILEEFLDDLQRMIVVDDVPRFDYRPDAARRTWKFFRDYENMITYGDDTRGKAF